MTTEHPVVLELASLKAALDKYQRSTHELSLQLQTAHFKAAEATAYSKTLEADNARLLQEVDFLRANPDTTPTDFQVSELTLALRRLSDKLSFTERTLLQRTTELTHVLSEKSRIQLETVAALAESDRARQREEAYRMRERELEQKCKLAEEEAKMAHMVVMEYADLVRALEGRRLKVPNGDTGIGPSKDLSPFNPNLTYDNADSCYQARSESFVQSFAENRLSLQRLLHQFNAEKANLQREITRLHAELSSVQSDLDCERENSRIDRIKLAEALSDVEQCRTDDAAAAKIVSRYMQFSQSSINTLQNALSTVKLRHAATLGTMSSSFEALSHSLARERQRASQLRDALEQLTEDISREAFGRRREVSLRLQSISREEKTVEDLNAWLRRAEERRARLSVHITDTGSADISQVKVNTFLEEVEAILDNMIEDARTMLTSLSHVECDRDTKGNTPLGRVILAEFTVQSLAAELGKGTEKGMDLTRKLAKDLLTSPETPVTPEIVHAGDSSQAPSSDVAVTPPPEEDSEPFSTQDAGSVLQTLSSSTEMSGVLAIDASTQPPAYERVDDIAGRSLQDLPKGEMTAIPNSASIEESTIAPETPLLTKLTRMSHRYDALQHAFRDCHLTLTKLKADLSSITLTSQSTIPVLQNVIHRLDDFCEDARVELEIRVVDEEQIMRGFETLLDVPNALTGETEKNHVKVELVAFLEGTSPSVVKAVESFTNRLEDLQHDIAQVKRVFHESIEADHEANSRTFSKTPPGWPSWTPSFLSGPHSRPNSPAPSFGTVITSPRQPRVPSNSRFTSESNDTALHLYTQLGLRIPMPSQVPPALLLQSLNSRLRNTSASSSMYLLGIGPRGGFSHRQDTITKGTSTSQVSGNSVVTPESDVE